MSEETDKVFSKVFGGELDVAAHNGDDGRWGQALKHGWDAALQYFGLISPKGDKLFEVTPMLTLDANEADAVVLWAAIHHLRAAQQGPSGYQSWQDAAVDERVKRVALQRELDELKAQATYDGMPLSEVQARLAVLNADELRRLVVSFMVMLNVMKRNWELKEKK